MAPACEGGGSLFAGTPSSWARKQSDSTARLRSQSVVDLNGLRVFAYVAALESFSKAAEALSIHKSSASRMRSEEHTSELQSL